MIIHPQYTVKICGFDFPGKDYPDNMNHDIEVLIIPLYGEVLN